MKDYTYIEAVDTVQSRGGIVYLRCGQQGVVLRPYAPGIIQVDYNPSGDGDRSWAVAEQPMSMDGEILETDEELTLTTPGMKIVVNKNPFSLWVFDGEGRLLSQDVPGQALGRQDQGLICCKKLNPNERFYGFGEKMGHIDRRGRYLSMWNTDVVPHMPSTDPMYQSIPFYITFSQGTAWGLFLDNTHRTWFDIGKTDPEVLSFGTDGGSLRYFIIQGPGIDQVLERYTWLTGRTPLPPKWALGYQQCRYSYHPDTQVLETARLMREKQIPCDVIYLDIHYMDGYRVFTFDPQEFPSPAQMVATLGEMGFKVVVIVDPGVKIDNDYHVYNSGVAGNHFVIQPDGKVFVGDVWPGPSAFPDFLKESTRTWWGNLHQFYLDLGVAGIWNDMNEPSVFTGPGKTMPLDLRHGDQDEYDHARVHNLYGMEMGRATRDGLLRHRPMERPFVLTRAGYAGVQRYSAVWLGDNSSWWEHLAAVVPMCNGMGLSGVSFVGTDIGGFVDDCTGELLARWTQVGALTPLCRNHSAVDTLFQEPWRFGPEVEEIARKFIRLRYQLMPYIYTAFHQASTRGMPIMRPLVLMFPQDENTWNMDDQFMLGDSLLVAPVVTPGTTKRMVYLPEGDWTDWWTGQVLQGGSYTIADSPLDTMPLYVRAGSIIPSIDVVNYQGERPEDNLYLDVYPAPHAQGQIYTDDGSSLDYMDGRYRLLHFTCIQEGPIYFKVKSAGHGNLPWKVITINFMGVGKPAGVKTFAGELLKWTYHDGILRVKMDKMTDLIIK